MRCLLLIILSGLLFSCTGNNEFPEKVMKPAKMQDVFWDFIRADIYTIEFMKNDSAHNMAVENLKLQDKIFAQHKITREEFYKSYIYYSNHKELMSTMIDSMVARKKRERIRVVTKPAMKSI